MYVIPELPQYAWVLPSLTPTLSVLKVVSTSPNSFKLALCYYISFIPGPIINWFRIGFGMTFQGHLLPFLSSYKLVLYPNHWRNWKKNTRRINRVNSAKQDNSGRRKSLETPPPPLFWKGNARFVRNHQSATYQGAFSSSLFHQPI